MTQTLAVDVNDDGLYTLSVPAEFEADGPFTVELHNHGEASHVFLNLDDRLSEVARIEATNHYLKENERRHVQVEARDPAAWPAEQLRGSLKVVVAHGQETRYVTVVLDSTEPSTTEVRVDPELSSPATTAEPDSGPPPLLRTLPVVVAGSIAVLLAVGALFVAGGMRLLLLGGAAVAAAVCGVAVYLLFE